jgi:hypothetical protein
MSAQCKWIDDENGPFSTECGTEFEFINDGIKENKFLFCPFCGGAIVEIHNTEEP